MQWSLSIAGNPVQHQHARTPPPPGHYLIEDREQTNEKYLVIGFIVLKQQQQSIGLCHELKWQPCLTTWNGIQRTPDCETPWYISQYQHISMYSVVHRNHKGVTEETLDRLDLRQSNFTFRNAAHHQRNSFVSDTILQFVCHSFADTPSAASRLQLQNQYPYTSAQQQRQ